MDRISPRLFHYKVWVWCDFTEEQLENEFPEVGGKLGKLLRRVFPKQNYTTLLPQEGACKLITGHFRDFHRENVVGALIYSLQKRQIRYSDRFWWCERLYIHLLLGVKLKFIFMKILWEVSWKKPYAFKHSIKLLATDLDYNLPASDRT